MLSSMVMFQDVKLEVASTHTGSQMQRLHVPQVMEFDWSIFLLLLSFSFRREEINKAANFLATNLSNGS